MRSLAYDKVTTKGPMCSQACMVSCLHTWRYSYRYFEQSAIVVWPIFSCSGTEGYWNIPIFYLQSDAAWKFRKVTRTELLPSAQKHSCILGRTRSCVVNKREKVRTISGTWIHICFPWKCEDIRAMSDTWKHFIYIKLVRAVLGSVAICPEKVSSGDFPVKFAGGTPRSETVFFADHNNLLPRTFGIELGYFWHRCIWRCCYFGDTCTYLYFWTVKVLRPFSDTLINKLKPTTNT